MEGTRKSPRSAGEEPAGGLAMADRKRAERGSSGEGIGASSGSEPKAERERRDGRIADQMQLETMPTTSVLSSDA